MVLEDKRDIFAIAAAFTSVEKELREGLEIYENNGVINPAFGLPERMDAEEVLRRLYSMVQESVLAISISMKQQKLPPEFTEFMKNRFLKTE